MSKFSLDVLQKHVFPFAKSADPDVLLGAAFGEDVALTRIGDAILASHVDPIVGAIGGIGSLAVNVAANDIATSGIRPRWILLLVLIPDKEDTELLESIMRDAGKAADELGASIIGGHTGYSAGLSRPLVAATVMGAQSGSEPVRTGGAKPGDAVLITKGIALEGTAILAEDFADVAFSLGLSDDEIREAAGLIKNVSVVPEALALSEVGASAMHDVTRGGLMETLLEIAALSDAGIDLCEEKLPIAPIISRFAEAFGYDPLRMISSGTLAVTLPPDHLEKAANRLQALDVPFAVVGNVVEGKGVRLIGEHEQHFTDIRCEDDELARLWLKYPRD
ncbi:MAG: AIR synthase family protein [Anaerolineales bacterium]|nr:AIR synthase family protein [Anaerolineales bacterium]